MAEIKDGAKYTMNLTAKIVQDFVRDCGKIPDTTLEISTRGTPGVEGTDELSLIVRSNLDGQLLLKRRQPI